ncbi:MAG: SDR family oxidoreductase [Deltaproteobacteria bacterium]|nr:SDR family oxidoreductase [Deltaproteobacteria bacterium]
MRAKSWSSSEIVDQSGKVAVVTGANSGLGFRVALVLAGKGARVVMACRNRDNGERAAIKIRREYPKAVVEYMPLDLADLSSVRAFGQAFNRQYDKLDILINNAGVMALPYSLTKDGFEMQFGTNHLGHFALTGLLLERLIAGGAARVVTVSSNAHKMGKMRFHDLHWSKGYRRWSAYGMSKLANLLFCYEFARKISEKNLSILSVAAHPGLAETNLFISPRMENPRPIAFLYKLANNYLAQDASIGSLPLLYAATAPGVGNGEYFGPAYLRGWRGPPKKANSNRRSLRLKDAAQLWQVSEELTGVKWAL